MKTKKEKDYNDLKNTAKENITTEKGQWPKNTTLIGGDFS